ncbi:MAG: hypothetical protein R3Y24_16790 [Eubacteriales bacterium]
MVVGMASFKRAFAGYEDCYTCGWKVADGVRTQFYRFTEPSSFR